MRQYVHDQQPWRVHSIYDLIPEKVPVSRSNMESTGSAEDPINWARWQQSYKLTWCQPSSWKHFLKLISIVIFSCTIKHFSFLEVKPSEDLRLATYPIHFLFGLTWPWWIDTNWNDVVEMKRFTRRVVACGELCTDRGNVVMWKMRVRNLTPVRAQWI